MKNNECLFRVGDKVWDFNYGWGIVIEIKIDPKCERQVRVDFDRIEGWVGYTKEGKEHIRAVRTLFFEEISIPKSALERPRKTALEMLEDCKEVEFIKEGNNYSLFYNVITGKVKLNTDWIYKQYGVKYISKKDAEYIIRECKENN